MPAPRDLVLGQGEVPAEDELRLPRPPGVIRRFWARHPLTADIVIAVVALLVALLPVVSRDSAPDAADVQWFSVAFISTVAACTALVWRRHWPVLVFAVALAPHLISTPDDAVSGPASLIALYSVAVYRSVRAGWVAFGAGCAALLAAGALRLLLTSSSIGDEVTSALAMAVLLLIAALIGMNVGNRRRYLDALIDRSRQLVVERDQQARLAAAAERTRLAREMHDIVSHSLTVVVALAEGASATSDPERAREATLAVAATAREALSEMRTMLGVLRTDDEPGAPTAPLLETSVHDVVASARAAGLPVTLTVTGDAHEVATAHRLAVLRIVQEGLTNAIRYAGDPRYVDVRTEYAPEAIRVTIENDGARGEAASVGTGSGLRGLHERVAGLGGEVTAGMSAPEVWRLVATIPVRTPHA